MTSLGHVDFGARLEPGKMLCTCTRPPGILQFLRSRGSRNPGRAVSAAGLAREEEKSNLLQLRWDQDGHPPRPSLDLPADVFIVDVFTSSPEVWNCAVNVLHSPISSVPSGRRPPSLFSECENFNKRPNDTDRQLPFIFSTAMRPWFSGSRNAWALFL